MIVDTLKIILYLKIGQTIMNSISGNYQTLSLALPGSSPSSPVGSSLNISGAATGSALSSLSVHISAEAKSLTMLSRQKSGGSASIQDTFHRVLEDVAQKKAQGGQELRLEKPNNLDASRVELADKAVDYVMSGGNNPFKGLSLEALSSIATDESGDFTSSEKYASILELSQRAGDYGNAIFSKKGSVDIETGKAAVEFISSLPAGASAAFNYIKEALLTNFEIANAVSHSNKETAKTSLLALTATELEGKTAWKEVLLGITQEKKSDSSS
ncbi:hypothetical protein HKW97_24940 (plasmid) [Pseudomonas luteola]|uniref:hypothetical protein n=1 Tax=Pseudomonas luteola TaxID=47886 RepID=UPI003890247D